MKMFKNPPTERYAKKLDNLDDILHAMWSVGNSLSKDYDSTSRWLHKAISYVEEEYDEAEETYLNTLDQLEQTLSIPDRIAALKNLIKILEQTEEFIQKELS